MILFEDIIKEIIVVEEIVEVVAGIAFYLRNLTEEVMRHVTEQTTTTVMRLYQEQMVKNTIMLIVTDADSNDITVTNALMYKDEKLFLYILATILHRKILYL